jgi:uroporphyrinogen-III decarboxylase
MVVDGTSQILIPKQFKRFSTPYTKSLIYSFNLPSILHICGNPTRLVSEMVATGANGLSLDWQVDFTKARKDSNNKVALIGGINVLDLLEGSQTDVLGITNNAKNLDLDVIAPGCGIMPTTPLENILTYLKAVKEGWSSENL